MQRNATTAVFVPIAICAAAVFSQYCVAAQVGTQIRMPGPAVQDLMLGTWSIRVRYEPSDDRPKGGVASGREVWRLGPGGRSLIEEYDEAGAAGKVHDFGVAWWDESAKGQRVFWCGDYEPPACTVYPQVARWDGNPLVQTVESDEGSRHVVRQEIFTDIKAGSFTQILKAGASIADLKTVSTITATRVLKRPRIPGSQRTGVTEPPARP